MERDIQASILQLANQTWANTDTQNTARSLMLLIHFNAARNYPNPSRGEL
ncbi:MULTISPECIES: hypothetical protein [unclassified Streptomyces]